MVRCRSFSLSLIQPTKENIVCNQYSHLLNSAVHPHYNNLILPYKELRHFSVTIISYYSRCFHVSRLKHSASERFTNEGLFIKNYCSVVSPSFRGFYNWAVIHSRLYLFHPNSCILVNTALRIIRFSRLLSKNGLLLSVMLNCSLSAIFPTRQLPSGQLSNELKQFF